jgi:uncharacterized protein (TIGR03437 family)
MKRTFSIFAMALLVCAAASAASISTTLTVNATAALGVSGATINGTASFTGGIGSGTLSIAVPFTSLGTDPAKATFTISGLPAGNLTGNVAVSQSILTGGDTSSASVKVDITSGTSTYVGATGSFTLTGSITGDILNGYKLNNFTGAGTLTTGGTPPPAVPTISAVQDAASNKPGITPGGYFSIYGSNLYPSAPLLTPFPRPTVSGGVKVTFTPSGGGTGTDVYLIFLGANQINGILPSTVAAGNYNVTVTNGTVSAPFAAQVVASKITLFTQDQSGSGLAVVQNYISPGVVDINRLTTGVVNGITISPAKPGQALIAYGTGLGAYAAGDNTASPAYDFSKTLSIQAVVGGVSIPVAYAGLAGYPGEDQINFTLPGNVPTGCAVSLQFSVNGKLSAATSIAIAADANASACTIPGYTTSQLQKLDQGGTITTGAFTITQFSITSPQIGTAKSNAIGGGFSQLTAFQLSSAAQGNVSVIQSGSCQVIQATSTGTTTVTGGSLTYLDAGTVTINGPGGSSLTNQALNKTNNIYSYSSFEGLSIPGGANFSLPAGTYTLSGAGGADVGTFTTSLSLSSPLVIAGGLPSTVNRSAPLTLNWTGGNASDLVEIIGSTSSTSGTGTSTVTSVAEFICVTTAGPGTFTVPASILGQMYASSSTNPGSLEVASGNITTTFTASLKAGGAIDTGVFGSFLGVGASPTYQ